MSFAGWGYEHEIAGAKCFIERKLVVIERLEKAIGPIWPFALRLEKGYVTSTELRCFYDAILRDDVKWFDVREQIDEWILQKGLFDHKDIAWFAACLVAGDAAFEREMQRLEQAEANGDAA